MEIFDIRITKEHHFIYIDILISTKDFITFTKLNVNLYRKKYHKIKDNIYLACIN